MFNDPRRSARGYAACISRVAGKASFITLALVATMQNAASQDSGVPFRMQPVGDQVVNGVLIQGARVPVWTDSSGRPSGQPNPSAVGATNQAELNELARIGRSQAAIQPQVAAAPAAAVTRTAGVATVALAQTENTVPATPAATVHRRTPKTDDEELANLERTIASAQASLKKKKAEIEERKKDEERRAEEARQAAEREVARQRMVFQAKGGQMLSEAISVYVGQNGWENLEWNVGPDFKVKFAYSERPRGNDTMKDVLLRVLEPYGLSAELHRPNSVVEVYPANETKAGK